MILRCQIFAWVRKRIHSSIFENLACCLGKRHPASFIVMSMGWRCFLFKISCQNWKLTSDRTNLIRRMAKRPNFLGFFVWEWIFITYRSCLRLHSLNGTFFTFQIERPHFYIDMRPLGISLKQHIKINEIPKLKKTKDSMSPP